MRKTAPASRIARRNGDAMRTGAEWLDDERDEQERDGRRDARTRRGAGRLDEGVVELVVVVGACCACRAPFVDGVFVVDACRDVVPVCFEPG